MRTDPVLLRPPLRANWCYFQGFGSPSPLASSSITFLISRQKGCLALDSSTGAKRWKHEPGSGRTSGPAFVTPDGVGMFISGGGVAETLLVEGDTGRVIRRLGPIGNVVAGEIAFADRGETLVATSLTTGETLWRRSLEPGHETTGPSLGPRIWAIDQFVLWCERGGRIYCVRARTGEQAWQASVGDLWKSQGEERLPGQITGRVEYVGGVLAVPVHSRMIGMSLDSGRRLWEVEKTALRGRGRCGDRLYLHSGGWIDPASGEYNTGPDLERPREWRGKMDRSSGDFLFSSTHVFGTTYSGKLDAWDRETGRHEWHEIPEGSKGYVYLTPLTEHYGRLYYVDNSLRTYCYESATNSDVPHEAHLPDPSLRATGARKSSPGRTIARKGSNLVLSKKSKRKGVSGKARLPRKATKR